MKVEIRYYTKGGNTKKLADAIAKELGVEAKTTDEPLTEDVDILFLGSSVYAYGVDQNIKDFIGKINVKVGKVVNFSTAALVKSTYIHVKKLLDAKNIHMSREEFSCRGSFGPIHKGKPDENDLENVALFAREVVNSSGMFKSGDGLWN